MDATSMNLTKLCETESKQDRNSYYRQKLVIHCMF